SQLADHIAVRHADVSVERQRGHRALLRVEAAADAFERQRQPEVAGVRDHDWVAVAHQADDLAVVAPHQASDERVDAVPDVLDGFVGRRMAWLVEVDDWRDVGLHAPHPAGAHLDQRRRAVEGHARVPAREYPRRLPSTEHRARVEGDDRDVLQVVGQERGLTATEVAQPEAREPPIEEPPRVVHVGVAHEEDRGGQVLPGSVLRGSDWKLDASRRSGARGGIRTPTPSRASDPKSDAAAVTPLARFPAIIRTAYLQSWPPMIHAA